MKRLEFRVTFDDRAVFSIDSPFLELVGAGGGEDPDPTDSHCTGADGICGENTICGGEPPLNTACDWPLPTDLVCGPGVNAVCD